MGHSVRGVLVEGVGPPWMLYCTFLGHKLSFCVSSSMWVCPCVCVVYKGLQWLEMVVWGWVTFVGVIL